MKLATIVMKLLFNADKSQKPRIVFPVDAIAEFMILNLQKIKLYEYKKYKSKRIIGKSNYPFIY